MLKYVDAKVVFQEVPDEITLAINISNCPCHCKGCHSSYLAEDIGTPLDEDSLVELLLNNKGITCIAFMGGDSDPEYINWLASIMRDMNDSEPGNWADVKIAWYSGRQELSPDIDLRNFDYIKLGPYIEEKGPLSSRTTNQVMLQIDNSYGKPITKDITSRFWK
jgi:anaerobic ribonucleoside-triphosphate reductase activating protein|uniref:Anaerobic ribonucleoside-triphosphate reductase activating protein n=1 Tax=Podoviridae sp. ct8Lf7 TaxID=2827723 RepID=A0A8S5S0G3_9CAUD|nr:MAG TPA: anaerobic ribonucleoside-triphosphate reductase activating protein [Podoviridae sp. ct8Lf7]